MRIGIGYRLEFFTNTFQTTRDVPTLNELNPNFLHVEYQNFLKNSEQTKVIFHLIWLSFVLNDGVLNDSIGATEY